MPGPDLRVDGHQVVLDAGDVQVRYPRDRLATPDFHLCRSPGADDAKRLTESLAFVAENGSALDDLREARALFEERLHAGGERTCISVSGGQLLFDSAHLEHDGQNLTSRLAPALSRTKIVLAEQVEIKDCQALLR